MTGGGWAPDVPQRIADEASAILSAVLTDFTSWGGRRVVTTWDDRLPRPDLPADAVMPVRTSSYREDLGEAARHCGAALVIAPEIGGLLERTTTILEQRGVALLGSPSLAVAAAADKLNCMRVVRQAGLPCPCTLLTTQAAAASDARSLGYPVVAKPRRGAGCDRVVLAADEAGLLAALCASGLDREQTFILQEYIEGDAFSVSLLASSSGVLPLAVNSQDVRAGVPFEYRGGVAGISHPRGAELAETACAAVEALGGLRGYVGVDLVVSGTRCVVIEVNPRLTTSYVGLRRVLPFQPAELLWRAGVDGVVPREMELRGQAAFRKDGADA